MCIISTEQQEADQQAWLKVTKTNIFARHSRPGFQLIAYSLSIASKSAAAMILPLPVVPDSGEKALRFIDLSSFDNFFFMLDAVCEPEYAEPESFDSDESGLGGSEDSKSVLKVHQVGAYEASYVPTMSEFERLDARFRLPEDVWQKMPEYADYGFAVFQLKIALMTDDEIIENTIHPMAFEFPTRDTKQLYYPTVHVHDGDFHQDAGFYHKFYCQRDQARAEFKYQRDLFARVKTSPAKEVSMGEDTWFEGYTWFYSTQKTAIEELHLKNDKGLIDPDKKIYAMSLVGRYPNHDMWLGDIYSGGAGHVCELRKTPRAAFAAARQAHDEHQ